MSSVASPTLPGFDPPLYRHGEPIYRTGDPRAHSCAIAMRCWPTTPSRESSARFLFDAFACLFAVGVVLGWLVLGWTVLLGFGFHALYTRRVRNF
jgi:hypothetical protein